MMRILFVDDVPEVLEGIQRMLIGKQLKWQASFAHSTDHAMAVLAKEDHIAVVTDICMPGSDGINLLSQVRENYPSIVRIALSGDDNREKLLTAVGLIHQYIAKPCNCSLLIATIDRTCMLHALLTNECMKWIVSTLDSIPSLPDNYYSLLNEMQSPKTSLKRVADIISRDPGMTPNVLHLVNSAFFGIRQTISNPADAVVYLGLSLIKDLFLLSHIFTVFDLNEAPRFSISSFWHHSAITAAVSKKIYSSTTSVNDAANSTQTAGLLHDVGKVILASKVPEVVEQTDIYAKQNCISSDKAENELLGATHAQLGAYLLGIWGLDDVIIDAVLNHHTPLNCSSNDFNSLTAVHVANSIVKKLPVINVKILNSSAFPDLDIAYLKRLGLEEKVPEWAALANTEVSARL